MKSPTAPPSNARQGLSRQPTPGLGTGPNRVPAGNAGIPAIPRGISRGVTTSGPRHSLSSGLTAQHRAVLEGKPSPARRGGAPHQKHPPIITGYENQWCKDCGYREHWSIHKVCPTDNQTMQQLYATYPVELDPPGTVDEPYWDAEVTGNSDEERDEAEDFFARAASPDDAIEYLEEEESSNHDGTAHCEERLVRVAEGDNDFHSTYYQSQAEQYNALFSVVEVDEDDKSLTNNVEYLGIRFSAVSTHPLERRPATKNSLCYTLIRPVRTSEENCLLVILTKINGSLALTLVDSACTTDAVSPDSVCVVGIGAEALEKEIPLQLGTAGSRSVIN